MKFFHTADWHLGKLIHGVYMTEDQRYILDQLIAEIERERPDALVIAGDLYDRAVPPTEAVKLLDKVLETIVMDLKTPVLAIAGNHDSPSRLHFASGMMQAAGFHLVGELEFPLQPVKLSDAHGEVHFHLVPFAEPGKVRQLLDDDSIRTYDEAMQAIVEHILENRDPKARHVFVGHAFVTPGGMPMSNTSDSERPLSIGGAEHISAAHFEHFHYTALGHLHKAHYVTKESIRYSGSLLKYSISEEHHHKGYTLVELDHEGKVQVDKRELQPLRDMRTVEGKIEEIERHSHSEDYVFIQLLDEGAVLHPMERIRSVYPNAMHVQRKVMSPALADSYREQSDYSRARMDEVSLFKAFYREVKGMEVTPDTEELFKHVLQTVLREEGGQDETDQDYDDRIRAI